MNNASKGRCVTVTPRGISLGLAIGRFRSGDQSGVPEFKETPPISQITPSLTITSISSADGKSGAVIL